MSRLELADCFAVELMIEEDFDDVFPDVEAGDIFMFLEFEGQLGEVPDCCEFVSLVGVELGHSEVDDCEGGKEEVLGNVLLDSAVEAGEGGEQVGAELLVLGIAVVYSKVNIGQ